MQNNSWWFSFIYSSIIALIVLKTNGLYLNLEEDYLFSVKQPYPIYDMIFKFLFLYFILDKPKTLDYAFHHSVNAAGIYWIFINNKYFGFLNNMLMFELSSPWLCLYMLTKKTILVVPIVVTYSYYRIYNTLYTFKYIYNADIVIALIHLSNTILNIYWFSKIIKKCYTKFIQN